MNKYIYTLSLLLSVLTNAQVGVNTNTPRASLDLVAIGENDETLTTKEGLLIPKVSLSRVEQMTTSLTIDEGILVYINNIDVLSPTGSITTVDTEGFYYFDGAYWIKLVNSQTDTTIYNTSDELIGDRVVNQATYKLAFTSEATSGTNHFSVDDNTLSVNTVNHRVGIGTINPESKLHVEGDLQFSGALKVGENGNPGNEGEILTSNGINPPTWMTFNTGTTNSFLFNNGLQPDPTIPYQIELGGKLEQDTEIDLNNQTFKIQGTTNRGFEIYTEASQPLVSANLSSNRLAIGTTLPAREFQIKNNLGLKGTLYLYDSSNPNGSGNPGNTTQYLTTRGSYNSPKWESISLNEPRVFTVSNGLQQNVSDPNTFQLGGDLSKDTSLETEGSTFTIKQGLTTTNDIFTVKNTESTASNPAIHANLNSNKQIGIGTNSPTNTLDINGELKIREIEEDDNNDNNILTITANGVVQKMNNEFATNFLGGSVYVYYLNGSPNEVNVTPSISADKLIGGHEGVSYKITEEQSAVSRKYGLQYIQGEGYKVSNPSNGVVDIMFDQPFNEIYGVTVNIFDTYKGSQDDTAYENIVGTVLYPVDNAQISFVSNNIIRVKTGDSTGKLANRSFSFLVIGK
jgi:hypothetical protein